MPPVLTAVCLFIILATPQPARAWNDCPLENVNDPYPGQCNLYVDKNNNGICDHSEPQPLSVKDQSTESGGKQNQQIARPATIDKTTLWFLLAPAGLYLLHKYIDNQNNKGKLPLPKFRRSWNLILLFLLIPTVVTSLAWIFGQRSILIQMWHNRFGAAFLSIAVIHTIERYKHFLK